LPQDKVLYINTDDEPSVTFIDGLMASLKKENSANPCAVVGIGGGITMDVAKAISNLYTNPGPAETYQGWDLLKNPGIYKIGVPTISGTGAEATRTCVLTNKKTGLKLGMNSDHTVFNQIIMDPILTETVPREQYFYTGMDAYIHCIEAKNGSYRNSIGDAFSNETIRLCLDVFNSENMMSIENREKLMVASYLGGCSIATSYVGLIHPFSAGLSMVFGLHHCLSNCIVMNAMEEFYPSEFNEFKQMSLKQDIQMPENILSGCSIETYEKLYGATIIHEKPLTNALGTNYKKILTKKRVFEIFSRM
jgi:3-deoxy-alpha-D-manno-octulosonate 8-oxidase